MSKADNLKRGEAMLADVGLDPTRNRLAALDVFFSDRAPMTAADVYEAMLRERKVNRVTVYRILDLLEDKGVLNRFSAGERAVRYCLKQERWPSGHSHIHCTACGAVHCIGNDQLHFDEAALGEAVDWLVDHVELRLDGVCPECQKG